MDQESQTLSMETPDIVAYAKGEDPTDSAALRGKLRIFRFFGWLAGFPFGESQDDLRTPALLAGNADEAPVRLHDLSADGEPEPASAGLGGEKRLEESCLDSGGNPRPIVGHAEGHDPEAFLAAHSHFSAPRHGLGRVLDEIPEHLLEEGRIDRRAHRCR